ncbi:MAG: hypothetical protein OXI73_15940 [Rhodospirillales bacterium]|nr:hypothetical protein [Rhodospirillales bacterium]
MFEPNRPPVSVRLRTGIRNLRAVVVLRLLLIAIAFAAVAVVGGVVIGLLLHAFLH